MGRAMGRKRGKMTERGNKSDGGEADRRKE